MAKRKTSRYRSPGAETVRDNTQEHAQGRGGRSQLLKLRDAESFKPTERRHFLDFLPYEVTAENHPDKVEPGTWWYRRTYYVHRNVGIDNKRIVCPLKTAGLKCPICEDVARVRNNPNHEWDAIKDLLPQERQLFNVMDLTGKNDAVQVWDVAQRKSFGELLEDTINQAEPEDLAFQDLDTEHGRTLRVKFIDDEFNKRKFMRPTDVEFVPREQPYEDDILDEVESLDEVLNILSYEAIQALYLELGDEEDEPSPKREEPTAQRRRRREDDGGDGEEESPAPRRRRASAPEDEPPEDKDKDEDEVVEPGEGEILCSRCEGRGKSSTGRKCRKCDGEGVVTDPDAGESGGEGSETDSCPHDHEFGSDTNVKKECQDCKVWDACQAEQDKQIEARKKQRRKKGSE